MKGVSFSSYRTAEKAWKVTIRTGFGINGKSHYFGCYPTEEEAAFVRLAAEQCIGVKKSTVEKYCMSRLPKPRKRVRHTGKERMTRNALEKNRVDMYDQIHAFGTPWWSCPENGGQCMRECPNFLNVYITDGVMHGYRCLMHLADLKIGFMRKKQPGLNRRSTCAEKEQMAKRLVKKQWVSCLPILNSTACIPWWNCPDTGKRCNRECDKFVKGYNENNKICGYKCTLYGQSVKKRRTAEDERERLSREVIIENQIRKIGEINTFGVTWWDCPDTGERCRRDCPEFIKACIDNGNKIHGYKCGRNI